MDRVNRGAREGGDPLKLFNAAILTGIGKAANLCAGKAVNIRAQWKLRLQESGLNPERGPQRKCNPDIGG